MAWNESSILGATPVPWPRVTSLPFQALLVTDIGPSFARDLAVHLNIPGAVGVSLGSRGEMTPTAQDFGADGDGVLRQVSEWLIGGSKARSYANLAAIQVDFPHVTSLTDSIDWAAAQQCIFRLRSLLPRGSLALNKPLSVQGSAISICGVPNSVITQHTNNVPVIQIDDDSPGHAILDVILQHNTVQVGTNTNGCAIGVRLDGSSTDRVVENLTIQGVRVNKSYALLAPLSTSPGSFPLHLSRTLVNDIVTDDVCRVVDWNTNSRGGYVARSFFEAIASYNSRAGAGGYLFDFYGVNRISVKHTSSDRQLDEGRFCRVVTGIDVTLENNSVVDFVVQISLSPMVYSGASQVCISGMYINLGNHSSSLVQIGTNASYAFIYSATAPIFIDGITIKVDQPSKLVSGTLSVVNSPRGGEMRSIDTDMMQHATLNSAGGKLYPLDTLAYPDTARLLTCPALRSPRANPVDATTLVYPQVLTNWDLLYKNIFVFKTDVTVDMAIDLPPDAFIEQVEFTIVRMDAGIGNIIVRSYGITVAVVGAGETCVLLYSQSVSDGWA